MRTGQEGCEACKRASKFARARYGLCGAPSAGPRRRVHTLDAGRAGRDVTRDSTRHTGRVGTPWRVLAAALPGACWATRASCEGQKEKSANENEGFFESRTHMHRMAVYRPTLSAWQEGARTRKQGTKETTHATTQGHTPLASRLLRLPSNPSPSHPSPSASHPHCQRARLCPAHLAPSPPPPLPLRPSPPSSPSSP